MYHRASDMPSILEPELEQLYSSTAGLLILAYSIYGKMDIMETLGPGGPAGSSMIEPSEGTP